MEYGEIEIDKILKMANGSFSFQSLTRNDLVSVAKFMETMGYLSIAEKKLIRRRKCRGKYLQNLSTIRDEKDATTLFYLTTQKKVGILGEEFMLIHAEIGLHFIIKGKEARQIESMQEENVSRYLPVHDLSASGYWGWVVLLFLSQNPWLRKVGEVRQKIESLISKDSEEDMKTVFPNVEKFARESVTEEIKNQVKLSRFEQTEKLSPRDSRIIWSYTLPLETEST